MGQVRQEDPVEVALEHDVGSVQVGVVEVAGHIGVRSLLFTERKNNKRLV